MTTVLRFSNSKAILCDPRFQASRYTTTSSMGWSCRIFKDVAVLKYRSWACKSTWSFSVLRI
eukprot:35565-Eustigmatos_ZCMA.PRE.1